METKTLAVLESDEGYPQVSLYVIPEDDPIFDMIEGLNHQALEPEDPGFEQLYTEINRVNKSDFEQTKWQETNFPCHVDLAVCVLAY